MRKIIATPHAPAAIGPYIQGVDLGYQVMTSGQIPVCPQTGKIADNVADQARQSLENVKATYPTRSCVQVARLPKDVKLEIEAIAVRDL